MRDIACADLSLIHAHFGPDAITALAVARRVNLPLIATFHGFDATVTDRAMSTGPYAQRLYLRQRALLTDRATLLLAVSQFLRSKLLRQGFPEEKTLVHYTGVDTDKFRPPPDAPRESLVLFVGRLVEKKGARFLIEALAKIHSTIPSLSAVLIGDGPERLRLEVQARGMPRVDFRGVQSPDQVRAELTRAKVLCVPSVTASNGDAEGFGMVFAEAQAMGVPVVSFASGGIPEAVAHGRTGLLSPERDVDALAHDLATILGLSDDDWRTMSSKARAYAVSHFDLRAQTDRLELLYDRAVASRCDDKRPGGYDR